LDADTSCDPQRLTPKTNAGNPATDGVGMIFRVPIYITGKRRDESIAQVYAARPLFFPQPEKTDDNLNRLTSKLARSISETLNALGKLDRHDELVKWSFSPIVAQHRIDVTIELRRRRIKCRYFFVVFKHMGRRLAFTPSVPDLWFEINRNESLNARAEVVLNDYFHRKERDDDEDPQPEHLSISGSAWVTTLELSVHPPKIVPKPDPIKFMMLGSSRSADGHEELRRVGRCLDHLYPDELDRTILRDSEVAELSRLLELHDKRPVLMIGPRQVGKTAIIHECVYRRVSERPSPYRDRENLWLLSPQRLISGMSYVGQWEDRLLSILREAKKKRHVLYFDDLLGLFLAGISASSTLHVAAVMKPYLEDRTFRMLGEITPEAFRVLQERDRSFADLFHLMPIREPKDSENLRVLIGVQRQLEAKYRCTFELDVLPTVVDIQRRYERSLAFPGKAAKMLRQLAVKAEKEIEVRDQKSEVRGQKSENQEPEDQRLRRAKITRDSVLNEFHAQSGLSLAFLDQRNRLERDTIFEALSKMVIGQPTSLGAATDVIAIAKARLNDPDRPLASFLFLGPTGVGKTECAKAIARYLFGNADRLVRFDMNEYIDPGSATRLVGTFRQPEGLLTSAIRRQPFAVVLLDEIEKAHPEIFDLLLQVLGEGRLTDALGRTADFSNAIILLTSNLGVREAEGKFGFKEDAQTTAAVYIKAAERFFRPEFFNRLDRVIPFRRLAREHIDQISEKLITDLLAREGFQQRKCILNVDPSARERIIHFGYDPVLGARALKRAIERNLTQPIASRLAATPIDSFTVISVFGTIFQGELTGENKDLIVDVQPLEQIEPLSKSEDALLSPEERLRRIEATLNTIVDSFAHLRPQGAISIGRVSPEQYRYFSLRDQTDQLRQQVREFQRSLVERRQQQGNPFGFSRQHDAQAVTKRKFTLRNLNGEKFGPLLQDMASAISWTEYLQELTHSATEMPGEHDFQELEHRIALLQMMSKPSLEEQVDVGLYLKGYASGTERNLTLQLRKMFLSTFTNELSLQTEVIELPAPEFSSQDAFLLVRGLGAKAFAELEQGTHLFTVAHEGIIPIRVFAYPLTTNTQPLELLREQFHLEESWRHGGLENNPFAFGKVVRLYSEPGNTVDLRTGLIVNSPLSAEALQWFLLQAIPIRWSEIPFTDHSEEETTRNRRIRAEQFDDFEE
jgi:ATP-dependent Clp protease ATP-binding subunit ClpC